MLNIDVGTTRNPSHLGAISAPVSHNADALVHVVDVDDGVHSLLTRWLTAAGIESRTYGHLGAFLSAHRADRPGCLVIDAQPSAISGLEREAILLPLTVRCPIVVTYVADVTMAVGFVKTDAINFVEKPFREREIVTAVSAAVEVDRQQRRIESHRTELRERFATLSSRERQVMALVTAGMLNKQIGIDLGLSEITIKAHRGAAMRKMRARTLATLVRMAVVIGEDPVPARNGRSPPARNAAAADRHTGCSLAPST